MEDDSLCSSVTRTDTASECTATTDNEDNDITATTTEEKCTDQIEFTNKDNQQVDCPFELNMHSQNGYQSCPIYKVPQDNDEDLLVPVPYPKLYRYRGHELRGLSRYEYCTQVRIMKVTNKTELRDNKVKRGRKKGRSYKFGRGFELEFSHEQMLRLKFCTLKLYQSPPPHPGEIPECQDKSVWRKWKKRADRFAVFFLILFRPEVDLYEGVGTSTYKYDWDTLLQFSEKLRDGSHFDKMRLRTMHGYMHGWRSNARDRAILCAYRGRKRTIWNKEVREMAMTRYGRGKHNHVKEHFPMTMTLVLISGCLT